MNKGISKEVEKTAAAYFLQNSVLISPEFQTTFEFFTPKKNFFLIAHNY